MVENDNLICYNCDPPKLYVVLIKVIYPIMGIQYNITDIANENNLIPLFLNLNDIAKWKCKSCNYIFDKSIKTIIYKTTAKGNIEKTSNKIKCEKCREKYILFYINSIAENKKGKLLSIKYSTKKSKIICAII